MIETRHNMPRIYSTSRDYQALMKLLDIIANVEKSDVDNLVSLLNADKCPSKYLPFLASYVGYDYDYSLTYETNRLIIKYYPTLIRHRGSEQGMMLACAVAYNAYGKLSSIQSAMKFINFAHPNPRELDIYVGFPTIAPKLFDLIEVVRPVGLTVKVVVSKAIRNVDKINIVDSVSINHLDIETYNRYKVMPEEVDPTKMQENQIGFGEVNETDNE